MFTHVAVCACFQMLLCVPEHQRKCYEDLIASPLLMLEQTLMNMKVGQSQGPGDA